MFGRSLIRTFGAVVGLAAGVLAVHLIWAGAAQPGGTGAAVAMDPEATGLRIEFLGGESGAWEGEVRVSAGKIAMIDLWHGGPKSRLEGTKFRLTRARQRQAAGLAPQLLLTVAGPANAQVELATNQGTARFLLSDVAEGKPLRLLDEKLAVHRGPAAFRISGEGGDEDFASAAAAPDGTVWVSYVRYQSGPPVDEAAIANRQFDSLMPKGNGDRVLLIRYDGKEWSAPMAVTDELGDLWRPAVAVDGQGNVWVTWSQQREGNWDLYQRRWSAKTNQWSAIERLTKEAGADINVVATRDSKGRVWWAWQAWRGDNFDILLASAETSQPVRVAGTAANEWSPAIAADSAGNVYVAWDSYAAGNYDVFVRRFGAKAGEAVAVADTAWFETRPSLACDGGDRVWVAYEEDEPNWGKDYATADVNRPVGNLGTPLYLNRRVRVKVLEGERSLIPAGDLAEALDELGDRPQSFPRVAADGAGNVWLFLRHHARPTRAGELWAGSVTRYDGRRWRLAQLLPSSDYILDNRPALAVWKGGGVVAVYSSDARLRTVPGGPENDLYAAVLRGSKAEAPALAADTATRAAAAPVHPREAEDIARMRAYRIEAGGKTYRLLRGEFHRHTEFTSHRDQDGGLEDMWRYGLDAAAMDWIGNGDHDNGRGREYVWWVIQKVTDMFHHPPHFVPPFTYERSVLYPNGHRNVMFSRRGVRPLPRGPLPGTPEEGAPDTKLLYAYLRHFGGICSIHTSGTRMGTDWRDNDPEVEPVVEIYQGHRHNYEHYGAPRSATPETQIGGYQPAGYVWNAWARGYRLGVQSSSDHVSTHMSYAVVLAEEASREGVVDAFRKRHCYGATDNIVLDVRAGEQLMGDEFKSKTPVRLSVKAIGTQPIRRAVVIKNNGYVYETGPAGNTLEFEWQDGEQPAGTVAYYYVRIEQADGQLAWSSPVWVRYE